MCKPTFISRLLSGVACTLLLSAVGSISYGADPYGVSPPSGKQWTMTFDDEFTQDAFDQYEQVERWRWRHRLVQPGLSWKVGRRLHVRRN